MSMKNDLKTKILFLHSGAELYGADQILFTIIDNIDKTKYEPIVVLPNNGPLVDKIRNINVECRIIEYPIARRKYFTPIGVFKYFKEYFKSCKQLKQIILDENISIVHNNTIAVLEGAYLRKKTNIKLISHIHEMIEKPKIVSKILYKIQLKHSDKVVVVSNSVKKHIINIYPKYLDKIIVINNGIKSFNIIGKQNIKENFVKKIDIPINSKIVAIIGRINSIKGQNDFVDSMEELIKNNENIYGIIVGDAFSGQEWRVSELKKYVDDKKINDKMIYCGFLENMVEVYNSIDLLVLPSVQYDSFPTVVLEAMSCGVPTIAYKCGGVEEMIINNENGILVEQHNISELKNKISSVILDDDLRNEMSLNSIKRFKENYMIDAFIDKIQQVYQNSR